MSACSALIPKGEPLQDPATGSGWNAAPREALILPEGCFVQGSGPDIYLLESGMKHVLPAEIRQLPVEQGKAIYHLDNQIMLRIPCRPYFSWITGGA